MAIQADHKDIINLIMGDLTQFHIPIYQRTYTWDADKQVDKLLDDIKDFGEEYKDNKRAEYYIGNVIVKNQTRGLITERVVIDGQQRITTSILILCAIRDIYNQKFSSNDGARVAHEIHKHLYSQDGTEIKLKLNNMENQQALTNLLSGSLMTISFADKQTKYFKNYEHIYKRISRMDEDTFHGFLGLLRRVKVVIIFLDEDQDENSVFESINSLGKPLAGSDLIKNYLFTFKNYECSHQSEIELTNLYTRTFEVLFKDEENVEQELEQFFRAYIAIKKQWLFKSDPKVLYYEFKKIIGEITSIDRLKEIICDLAKWALIYQTVRVKKHPDINFNYINYLRTTFAVYSTLMMKFLEHYSHIESNELIIDNPLEFEKAIKSLVAYDASRFLANYPRGEVVRFIPMVFNRLNSNEFSALSGYGDRFLSFVSNAEEGYRLPSIKVLKESVISNDLYSRKLQHIKRFLILLENIGKNELLDYEKDLKKAQVEHIIPQNPVPGQWTSISFDDHEKYLHTLGNLTLTFDNQSLSNKVFADKKKILIERSRIKLNNDLLKYDDFNVKAIESRAESMLRSFLLEFLDIQTL
ncbi:MAG: DUF262 domain-containing HNH endonuclease family protein [Chlorobium sp.]